MRLPGTYISPAETGLYYLESHYYNPEIGRFINADRYISTGVGILGYNMFAYCNNNPIRFVDYSGEFVEAFLDDADDALGFLELLGVGDCGGGTYHYAVDFSHAERSSVWGYPLLNGEWSSYSYWSPMYGGGGTSVGAATKGGLGTKAYMNGKAGEKALANMYGGKPQAYFKTSKGGRYIDQLANGIAHESKVGYTALTNRIRTQVLKDAELINTGRIDGAYWHFFTSGVTNRGGASQPLIDLLIENGIRYKIH